MIYKNMWWTGYKRWKNAFHRIQRQGITHDIITSGTTMFMGRKPSICKGTSSQNMWPLERNLSPLCESRTYNYCPWRSPPIIGSFRSLPHTQTFSLPFKLLLDHVKVDNNPRHHPTFHRHSVGLLSSQSSSPSSKNGLNGLKQGYHLPRLRHHQHWKLTSITLLSLSKWASVFWFHV